VTPLIACCKCNGNRQYTFTPPPSPPTPPPDTPPPESPPPPLPPSPPPQSPPIPSPPLFPCSHTCASFYGNESLRAASSWCHHELWFNENDDQHAHPRVEPHACQVTDQSTGERVPFGDWPEARPIADVVALRNATAFRTQDETIPGGYEACVCLASFPSPPPTGPPPLNPPPSSPPLPSVPAPSPPPPSPPVPTLPPFAPSFSVCEDDCERPKYTPDGVKVIDFSSDSTCDDGGPGAEFATCPLGHDCADCGVRHTSYPSPPPAAPT
jgi:hypothetical protein